MQKGLVANRIFLYGGLLLGVLLAFYLIRTSPAQASAGINQTISFQGRLLNGQGATVPDGFYNIEFKIYQDGDGQSVGDSTGSPSGSLKWTEDYLNHSTQGVRVVNGYLSVQLGSLTAFGSNIDWNQGTLWLSMNIAGTGSVCATFAACSPDGEMVPMQPLTSAPYAFNSSELGGLTANNFVQLAQGVQTDSSTTNPSIFINKTGATAAILELQKSSSDVLLVANDGSFTLTPATTGTITLGSSSETGTITVGQSTAGQTINVGHATVATGNTQTIQIGDSATGTGKDLITVGNTNGGSTLTLNAGTGGINLNGLAVLTNSTLTSGKTGLTQTFTNTSSTGGTIDGFSLSGTVNNTSSSSTTNGLDISINDTSSGLGNTNRGLNVSLTGSANAIQIGVDSSVTRGISGRFINTNSTGASVSCANQTGNLNIALCADNNTSAGNSGAGTYSRTTSDGAAVNSYTGSGVYGLNNSSLNEVGRYFAGVKGISTPTGAAAYTTIGVYGESGVSTSSSAATTYGGYFTLNSGSTATLGSALYGSNSTIGANILQLQDETGTATDVLVVGDGGSVSITPSVATKTITIGSTSETGTITLGQSTDSSTISIGSNNSLASGKTQTINIGTSTGTGSTTNVSIGSSIAGTTTVNGNFTLNTGKNFTVNGDVFTDLTGTGLTNSSNALSIDQTSSLTWTGTENFNGATAFTPSGGNNVTVNGDNDSKFQVLTTLTSDVSQNGVAFTLTDNASASTGTVYGLAITNNDNGANVGVPDALAYLKNDNAAETVNDGLLLEQTGAGTLTNGLEIKRTAGTITNGLVFSGTGYTNYIDTPSSTFKVDGSGNVTTADITCASTNCITLGTETGGNYVQSVTNGTGIAGGNGGSEGATLTLSIDQTASLTWTGTEAFNGATTFTPSGSNNVVVTGDDNSNIQIASTVTGNTSSDGLAINWTDNGNGTNTAAALKITNAANGANAGVPAALAYLLNSNNTADTIPDGLLVEQNGSSSTLSSGIEVKQTAGTLSTGLQFTGTFGNLIKVGSTVVVDGSGNISTARLSGNYVATIANGTGISGSCSSNACAATIAIDQTASLTWTGTENFNGATAFTPSGGNSVTVTGDDDSNFRVNNTIGSDVSQNGLALTLTDNAGASTGTVYGLAITNADNGANVGVPDAIAFFRNDNAAETVPDGLLVEQTGAGTLTNGLEIKRTAGTITNGIVFSGTGYTNYIDTPSSTFKVDGSGNVTTADITCASTTCITLGTETGGNYVQSVTNGTGIAGGNAGSEGATLTLSIDQTASLTWTGTEAFNGSTTFTPGGSNNVVVTGDDNSNFQLASTVTGNTSSDGLAITWTDNGSGTNTAAALKITNAANGANAGVPAALAYLLNSNNTADTIPDGLLVEQNGASSTLSSGIEVKQTAGTLSTGLQFTGTFGNLIKVGSTVVVDGSGNISTARLSGNYVASIANGTGISGTCSSNACAATISIDQTASLTWTGTENFNGATAFTPSGGNNVSVNGDDDSNFRVASTISSDSTQNGLAVTITDNASASTGTLYGLSITNADNTTNTGVPDAIAYLKNDNAGETVPDGLLIEQTGAGTLTNGLEVKRTAGTITNGLVFSGTGYTNYIDTPSSTFKVDGSGNVTTPDITCASTTCITLGTETGGNYVQSITNGTGIAGGNGGGEGSALTLSIDQSSSLTWTGTEAFNGATTFTPSGSNNVTLTGDNDSNVQVSNTLTSDVTQTGLAISLTDNASASTGSVYGLSITNNDNTTNTGVPDAIAYLKNANAAETVPDGLLVEQTGAGTLTNGLEIKRTAGTISNGLAFTGSFTNLISTSTNNFTVTNGGAVSASGNLTVGASAGSGTVITNNGAMVNATLALTDFAAGGSIGTAAATVDIYTSISVAQTTSGQTLTIPSPTASTAYGRVLYLSNIGTNSFTVGTTLVNPGGTATLVWSNTNGGASWQFAGVDNNSITNQSSADQTGNFRITGTGRANTSFTTPLVDSITGGLSLGTATATGVTIGGTTNTTAVTLQGAASAVYTLGTSNNTGGITVGNSTDTNTIAIGNANTATGKTQTINIGAGTPAGTGLTNITIGNSINSSSVTLVAGSGNINLNSGTITTNASTLNLFNSNATTVNQLQAATTISMGATTGTLTVRNANQTFGNAAGSGVFTNNGATLNTTLALTNFNYSGSGNTGSIGSAASTVDIYTSISINQTTAGQTLTIPTPTASTSYGRTIYLANIGTASFIVSGIRIPPGSTATLIWSNTNSGASWHFAGAGGTSIENQNTSDQSADFRISGTGRANTSFTTPLVDSITGGLSLGTSTATGVTIGGTTNTSTVTLQGAAGVSILLGNAAGMGVVTNNGSTVNTTLALGDFSSGGSIGTAANTVDKYTSASVAQTTLGQTLTIPTPTASTTYGRTFYLSNIGTQSFIVSGIRIPPGATATLVWSNTNGGASWHFAGAGGTSIENQNAADQSADFRISGTGRANTSFVSPLFDSISGALGIGTSTATGVNIGGTTNTTSVLLQGAAGATYTIGTSGNTGGITVGNSTATNTISIGSSAGNGNTQTINIGTSSTSGSTTRVNIGSSIAGYTQVNGKLGVGTSTTPNETLQVNGAINIGTTTSTNAGTIRYNTTSNDFEGYNGTQWKSMTTQYLSVNPVVNQVKSSDTVFNNNNTPANDPVLKFTIGANETWNFRFVLALEAATRNAGWKVLFDVPQSTTSCVYGYGDFENGISTANSACTSTTTIASQAANNAPDEYEFMGIVVNGSTAQTITIKMSQNTATATNSTVRAGSFLQANRVLSSGDATLQAFVDNGNTFGAIADLGTNDAFDLNLQTNGQALANFSSTNGAATFKNYTNSTAGFQVQNSTGGTLFNVDTSNSQVVLGKASTTTGNLAFANSGVANTVTLSSGSTSSSYTIQLPTSGGSANQCLQYGGSGGTQLQWGACGTNSTGLTKNAADSSSASVSASSQLYSFTNAASATAGGVLKLDNGTNTNSALVVTASGNPTSGQAIIFASNTNASPTGNLIDLQAGASPTSKFSVSAAGAVTASSYGNITGTGALSISSGGATALNLDTGGGAAINIGATNATSLVLGGNTSATITEKVANSSTTAYQLQTAGATNYLVVDSTNSKLVVGTGSAGEASGIVFVLDSDSNSTYNAGTATSAPTEVDGAMFYSKTDHNFMCGIAGAWETCNGLLYSNTGAGTAVNTCTTACGPAGQAPIPANYCQAGRSIHILAKGTWGDTTAAPTIAFGVYYGTSSTKASDTLIGTATPAVTGTSTSSSGMAWTLDVTIICFSTSSMNLGGTYVFQPSTTTTTTNIMTSIPASTTSSLTTNTAQNLYIFPAFGTNNGANSVTLQQLIVTGN